MDINSQPYQNQILINNLQFQYHINNIIPNTNINDLTNMNKKGKFENSLKINNDLYLQPYNFPNISTNVFNSFLTLNFESADLEEVKQKIISLPIITDFKHSIGPFCYLTQLIELSYNFEPDLHFKMLSQYKRLYSTIYKYRKVKGDGNCYYRAIIVAYFEHIILSSNLQLFQNLIYDIKQSFEDKLLINNLFINSTTQIKPQLLLKIIILIYVAMKKNNITIAYELFSKAINNCLHFDYGLVLYFRFILYKYIKSNETKFYKKDFGIQIGNLLPSQYETKNGLFLFEDFYNNYLLKMNQDAEKIVIYITPYVLSCKVNVLIFDCEYENYHNEFNYRSSDISKDNIFQHNNYSILLIANKEHYEIGYCKNYYSIYKSVFQCYKAEFYQNIILSEIDNEKEEMNDFDLLTLNNNNSNISSIHQISNNNGTNINLMSLQSKDNANKFNNQSFIQDYSNITIIPSIIVTCFKCKQQVEECIQEFGICDKCFKNEIILYLTHSYIKCLKSFKFFFKTNKNVTEYMKMFSQMFNTTKILINKKDISIDQAIQLHNRFSSDKIYLNIYLTQIKALNCLNCTIDIVDLSIKIILPCMCQMCSGQCINEYYSKVNKIEYRRQKEFCCHCGTIYEPYQLLSLGLLLSQFQLHQIKNDILMLHKNIIKGKCSKCQNSISTIKEKIIINCSNIRNELVNLLGITSFNHSICQNCYSNCYQNNQNIYFCLYCKCDHLILKQMSCNSDEGFI